MVVSLLMKGGITLENGRNDWLTPPEIVSLVNQVAPIALDPCSGAKSFVNAWWKFYGPATHIDGLTASWRVPSNALVYVNPPYGKSLWKWCAKMMVEGQHSSILSLIPARVGTAYWRDFVWNSAKLICFWNGGGKLPPRVSFYDADTGRKSKNGTTFDVALLYWGRNAKRFGDVFGEYGQIVSLRN